MQKVHSSAELARACTDECERDDARTTAPETNVLAYIGLRGVVTNCSPIRQGTAEHQSAVLLGDQTNCELYLGPAVPKTSRIDLARNYVIVMLCWPALSGYFVRVICSYVRQARVMRYVIRLGMRLSTVVQARGNRLRLVCCGEHSH